MTLVVKFSGLLVLIEDISINIVLYNNDVQSLLAALPVTYNIPDSLFTSSTYAFLKITFDLLDNTLQHHWVNVMV